MRLAFRRTPDSADSPPYLPLLKLHTPPFASRAGSSFFYADAERTQYLDMLQHLTQYSEELLLVIGGEGIGKSALLDKYLERSEEHWRLCRLNGEQGVDLDTLFARVAECFAVDMARVEASQLLDALRQHLDALLEQQLSVLVVDDAQSLSDDALEMVFHLASLEGEHGKLIRVLLFADSAIDSRLASSRFEQLTPPHRLQLKPLQETDSSNYLLHRLQQAGYSGASPFNVAELKQLHRQSQGIPARLNQAAHVLLMERIKGGATRSTFPANSIRMGVAATALIGTVLGMHDRINGLLGGDEYSSMAMTAERPVLRIADEDNPWAVVIRDGESIQISCGAPLTPTVAVRPTPAAAPLDAQAVMKSPLIQPVSTPEEEATAPAQQLAAVDTAVTEAPMPPPQSEKSPAAVPTQPQAEAKREPAPQEAAVSPPQAATTPPLVIKPPLPSIVPELPAGMADGSTEEPAVVEKPAEPEKLTLEGVSPDPVIGSDQPQTITIFGSGLEQGSKVAVSWGGKVKALDNSQVVVRDSSHMDITITTGLEPVTWAVQVSTPSKQRSNVLRFEVEAPKPEAGVEEKKSEPARPARKKPVTKKSAAKKLITVAKDGKIKESSWVAAQPAGNFTLQLLATSEAPALDEFVAAHPGLKEPLASFTQQRGGKNLHVLLQGSYPDRAQAEVAARTLPDKVKPWIRDFSGIKKVMTAPVKSVAGTVMPVSDGIKDTAWVWSQNPNQYTIQLAGASDEASIEAVMRGLSLPGELVVVQSQRNGQPWYALVYGRFATMEAAKGTITRLPASLKKAGPWIRRFAALQAEIGQAAGR